MRKLQITVTILILYGITIQVYAQESRRESRELRKEQQYQALLHLIESKEYEFRGNKANPQKGPQVDLTTRENFLKIDNGTAFADLPYFGRAFVGGYSGGGGIEFDAQMETYEVDRNDKKRRLTIQFRVKRTDDTFNCTITASGTDNASLSIISTKRQTIRYLGELSKLSE